MEILSSCGFSVAAAGDGRATQNACVGEPTAWPRERNDACRYHVQSVVCSQIYSVTRLRARQTNIARHTLQ